jgi:hypothetical protein
MSAARFGASAVALGSGLVLIAGGFDGANLPAAAELFDPVAGLFEGIGASLNVPRFAATATLLNDGQVLVAGGSSCASGCPTNAAEIYDPLANTFSVVTGGMTSARFDHTATLVNNGQVYIAGGFSSCSSSCTSVASTDIFDPVAVTFTGGPVLNTALAGQTATLVASGDVLLTGGINAGVTVTGDTWYQPASLTPPGLLSIAVTPASLELVLGQPQQFVATGTFNDGSTQTLQSVLWSSSNSSVATVSNAPGSAGTVTAFSAGATKLTATAGNVSGSASLRVATLVTLSISPTLAMVGVPQQFTASGTLSDGSVLNLTALATWSSGSPNSLTFEGNPGTALGTTSGSFNVTATVGTVSQTVSVVVQSAPPPPAPSITGVTPSSGVPGTVVTISGTGFGATQGTGSVTLGSTVGTVITWSSTQIQAVVASNAVTGSVTVQESGVSSNSILFTVNRATISGVSPSTAAPGKQITIAGTYFSVRPRAKCLLATPVAR